MKVEHASHMLTLIHAQHKNALTLSALNGTPEKEMQRPGMFVHSCSDFIAQKLLTLRLDSNPQIIYIHDL